MYCAFTFHVLHISLDIHEQHDLVFHNINKYYLYVDFVSFVPWMARIFLSICMGSSFGKVIED